MLYYVNVGHRSNHIKSHPYFAFSPLCFWNSFVIFLGPHTTNNLKPTNPLKSQNLDECISITCLLMLD